ncbi:MAG: 16S rRNA (uracil(1498)-N(3))-methyltransferase [Fuerstiella sp.]|nr:16S rRNA (uracil(1498)-N(3))-methyltransferase [Fuerstiella sp.]
MPARFYCKNIGGRTAELDEAESHHVQHVLRLSVGDEVELFDGSGASASASVANVSRNRVDLTVNNLRESGALSRARLIVAAAPPRGDRLKSMVEKLTEIGVDDFIPLRTVRSVVDPRQSKLEKLRTTVIGAMKQSGRNHLMKIHEATDFSVALRTAAAERQIISLAHPGDIARTATETEQRDTLLLIGPEGGFTREEVLQASDYGATRISWPEGILRIETATVVFAGLLISRMYQTR